MFLVLSIVAVIAIFYLWSRKSQNYFKDQGVPQNWQFPILGDNYKLFFRIEGFYETIINLYNKFPDVKYFGMCQFRDPILVIKDPDLIKQITVKDFEHFTDHRQFIPEGTEPLWSKNLFALTGTKWRHMRATLSPNFTGSKMKMMFTLMTECAEQYSKKLLVDCEGGKNFEMKDLFTRYANDVIASTAFGIQVDSYSERKNKFYEMGKVITDFTSFRKNMAFLLYAAFPMLSNFIGITFFEKEPSEFFIDLVKRTVKMREEQGIVRPDLINLLMEARKGTLKEDEEHEVADTGFAVVEESHIGKAKKTTQVEEMTDMDICAQALIFFFAGFDSISTMMCFMAYELAVNPDIQERLQAEIDTTFEETDGKLTYEAVMKMKYLDMVVSETLRKWPNAIAVDRACTVPYTIKPETPEEKPIHFKKNSILWIPIIAIHRDPKHYPNPDKFDPERFSDENKSKINPYVYLPFGVGPRNCIGSRFALLEIKIIFCHILSKMDILPNSKTPIPMKIKKGSFQLIADPGFFVDIKPRKL